MLAGRRLANAVPRQCNTVLDNVLFHVRGPRSSVGGKGLGAEWHDLVAGLRVSMWRCPSAASVFVIIIASWTVLLVDRELHWLYST